MMRSKSIGVLSIFAVCVFGLPGSAQATEYEGYLCQLQYNPMPGNTGQFGNVFGTIHSQPACQGQQIAQVRLCSTGATTLYCYTDRLYDSQRTLSIHFGILRDHAVAGRKIIVNLDAATFRTNNFFLLAE